jgi:hypothetical protein
VTSLEAQTALYEKVVEDKRLESALEARQAMKLERKELNKRYREADAKSKAFLEELELGDNAVVRVGRFLVSRRPVAARDVAFSTDPTSRLQISLLPE